MKRFSVIFAAIILMMVMCTSVFSNAGDVSDPSDIYVPQVAEYEDSSIKMWFEHSFKKVMTSDTTPSEMDTYSVYMGKNEIENAQVVLCSDETKEKMRVSVTDFKDEYGNTIDAEMYYQLYVTLSDVNTLDYYGATAENTFIHNGEYPDPMIPFSKAGRIQLNAGKSQAFYIRLTTTEDTVPGWYSGTFKVFNSKGQIVKTATVYAYVWDFIIDEATEFRTSLYLGNRLDGCGTYQEYYDYLLENRLIAMDVPGNLDSSNPYLTNERVNSIRVTASNGGNNNTYMELDPTMYYKYADIYTDLSAMKEWEEIKDKFYFYTIDEATSDEHQTLIQKYYESLGINKEKGSTVDDIIRNADVLSKFWPNATKVNPYHENHPYPYNVYNTQTMAKLDPALRMDGVQAMMDNEATNLWCPQHYAFTPLEKLEKIGYDYNIFNKVRSLSCSISGSILAGESYFNWERVFGEYRDRVISYNLVKEQEGADNNELWAYLAGTSGSYTYANHLIENTGLQTKMLFWQFYQNDITGYLYYGVNQWSESDLTNGNFVDKTVTGAKSGQWKTNKYPNGTGYSMYGNGVLVYGATQYGLNNVDYIGSIRVEMMRDGIEEYQMLKMLEELRGDSAADAIVDSVSNNVAEYLSLPDFDRSAFDSSMDDYDIMAMKRIELGNQLEAATDNKCEHVFDNGVVTLKATCLSLGEKTFTCKKCGAKKIEYIPAIHSTENSWKITTVEKADCNKDGKYLYQCTICGYAKYRTVKAYHNNADYLEYTQHEKIYNAHNIICSNCNETIGSEPHLYQTEYTNTCVDSGVQNNVCIYCHHTEKVADVEAHGHNFAEGKCKICGEIDPDSITVERGDIDGSGTVTMADLFRLKMFVKQIATPTAEEFAAADVTGDGYINMMDSFELKYRIVKGSWRN